MRVRGARLKSSGSWPPKSRFGLVRALALLVAKALPIPKISSRARIEHPPNKERNRLIKTRARRVFHDLRAFELLDRNEEAGSKCSDSNARHRLPRSGLSPT